MRRSLVPLLALAAAASTAFGPVTASSSEARDGRPAVDATVGDEPFPVGVCAWARPVSSEKICVTVNDPRPWLPPSRR